VSTAGKTSGREAEAASQLVVEVGNRLRRVREDRGLSLRLAADSSSGVVRKAALDSYERATRAITVVQLAKLAHVYDVPVTDLLPVEHWRRDTLASRWRFDLSAMDDGSSWDQTWRRCGG
jgi:transcriptional regulator with XRE-family HTH domain